MSRTLTTAVSSAVEASEVRPFYLFEAEFVSETLRLFSGGYDLTWNSETWLGNGWFKGLSNVKETGGVESSGVEVTLSGVPDTLISLVLGDSRQNLTGKLYLGFFDSSWSIIADPFLFFEGGLDVPKISDSNSDLDLILTYENHLVFLKRKRELRFTDQTQQALFPGDLGFQFVNSLAEWSGYWGKKVEPPTSGKKKKKRKS